MKDSLMNDVKIISVEAKKSYYLVTTSINDYKFDEDTIVKYEVFNDKVYDKKEFDFILNKYLQLTLQVLFC